MQRESQGTTVEQEEIYKPLVFHWTLVKNSAANISSPNLQMPPMQTCYPRVEENSIQWYKLSNKPDVNCAKIFSNFSTGSQKNYFSMQGLFLTFSQQPVLLSLGEKQEQLITTRHVLLVKGIFRETGKPNYFYLISCPHGL